MCRRLPHLQVLSLRRCMFLKGALLAALAPPACPALRALDLAGCGISLHLHVEVRREACW